MINTVQHDPITTHTPMLDGVNMVLAVEVIGLYLLMIFLSFGYILGLGHPHANARHNKRKMVQDKEHLKEDLEERFSKEAVENMTEEEKNYHYFRLHDFDKNDKLDGLEVLKAVNHVIEEDGGGEINSNAEDLKVKQFDLLVEMIDKVLELDDTDKDGLLSYSEFVAGRRRGQNEESEGLSL